VAASTRASSSASSAAGSGRSHRPGVVVVEQVLEVAIEVVTEVTIAAAAGVVAVDRLGRTGGAVIGCVVCKQVVGLGAGAEHGGWSAEVALSGRQDPFDVGGVVAVAVQPVPARLDR
jgi:hypothetical protein